MNAPLIWIGLPMLVAGLLLLLQRKRLLVAAMASAFCGLLMLLTGFLPIDSVVQIGPLSIEISSVFVLLGRRFVLNGGDMPFLALVYGIGMVWFLAAITGRAHRYFVPLGLGIIALLVAARAVEPFLYSALLIEMAVLFSIPIFAPPEKQPGQGVLRYLIFETMGLPFLLLAGWAAAAVEANPADQVLLVRAVVMLGLGFAFWLAVFPFYTWIPLLMDEVEPYAAGFVISLVPTVVLLFLADFINNFAWLRAFPLFFEGLRLTGVLMVVTGGLWAAFQNRLARMFAYAVIIENGFALLALSLNNRVGFEIFVGFFIMRILAAATWSLAHKRISAAVEPDLSGICGLIRHFPLSGLALVVSAFSFAGLPLLAGFPLRLVLLENLAKEALFSTVWVLIGQAGMLFCCFRLLAALIGFSPAEPAEREEIWPAGVLLAVGVLAIFIAGLAPSFVSDWMLPLLNAFSRFQ